MTLGCDTVTAGVARRRRSIPAEDFFPDSRPSDLPNQLRDKEGQYLSTGFSKAVEGGCYKLV